MAAGASAGASVEAGASDLGSAGAFSVSFDASPVGAASLSPPSDEVQSVKLSRRSCMMRVLSR